jgi:tetratricopeptide (TPR) repeat protein
VTARKMFRSVTVYNAVRCSALLLLGTLLGAGALPENPLVSSYARPFCSGNKPFLVATVPAPVRMCSSQAAQTMSAGNKNAAGVDEALRNAEKALQAGRTEAALAECENVVAKNPQSAHAYYLLGVIQARRGATAEAQKSLLRATKLEPSSIASHMNLGRIYLKLEDLTQAAQEFQRVMRLGDPSGQGSYALALVLLKENRYSEALVLLQEAVHADPRDPERVFTLIATELKLDERDKARDSMRALERLALRDPWLLYRLGKLSSDYKMAGEAEEQFDRAAAWLESARDDRPADIRRADLYLQISRLRFAHHDYRGALESLSKVDASGLTTELRAAALDVEGRTNPMLRCEAGSAFLLKGSH